MTFNTDMSRVRQRAAKFTRYREWIASAPDELTSAIVIMNYPPLRFFPVRCAAKRYG